MKRNLLFLIFCFYSSVSLSQQIMWERKWQGNQPISSFSTLDKDQDTSIVVSGSTYQFSGGPFRAFFIKYDKYGTQLWQKYGRVMMSGEQDVIGYGNGYLFAGTQQVQPPASSLNFSDIGLHWLNSRGDTLQNSRYGSPLYTDLTIKILPVNNDIYILGSSFVDDHIGGGRSLDYSLLKLDNNGTTQQWFKTYGSSTHYEYANSLLYNRRGNLVMSGVSDYQSIASTYHPFFVEVDTGGNVIQAKKVIVKNPGVDELLHRMFHNIAETADGNYILTGSVKVNSNTHENFIAKLDTSFNVLWVYYDPTHTSYYGYSKVQPLSDGSYAVLMSGDAALPGDYHIVRISATGQFVTRTPYNSNISGPVLTYDWEFLGDGSVVIAGRTDIGEAYIARLGNVGVPAVISTIPEPIAKAAKLGQSYPNPAAMEATIPYEVNPGVKEAELRIYEIATGRIIQVIRLDVKAPLINLDLKPIRQGVYSYTLVEDGMPTATKKMVVLK